MSDSPITSVGLTIKKKKSKTAKITLENLLCYTKYEHTATFVSQKI